MMKLSRKSHIYQLFVWLFFLKKNGAVVILVFCVSECQKWQRRFFILYEDGSLRFALDEQVRNCDRKTHFEP